MLGEFMWGFVGLSGDVEFCGVTWGYAGLCADMWC